LAQALLLAAVAGLIAWLGHNVVANMQARGLASGFDFLSRPAGFDIAQTLVPYGPQSTHGRVFLVGALNTLLIAALGIVTATAVGLLVGVARVSRNFLARNLAAAYVEVARNIPLPIQLLVWYSLLLLAPPPRDAIRVEGVLYFTNRGLYLPKPLWNADAGAAFWQAGIAVGCGLVLAWVMNRRRAETGKGPAPAWGLLAGVVGAVLALAASGNPSGLDFPRYAGFDFAGGMALSPPLVALWAALSFYTGAFIGEIVRGGLNAVSAGQAEAARSLGLGHNLALRLVILPQALRVIVPPLASQYLNLTKNSSLAVIVGYPDLVAVFAGTSQNQTGQAVETLALTMAFYLAVSLSISAFMNWRNSRTARWAAPR
jgi:general L-amino acid transport system permease protein